MNTLDLIENQLVANRLPIVAVTLAALPHANTPVILTIHWHGFVEIRLTESSQAVAFKPVPSSVLQVNTFWALHDDLEHSVLEAAWELGARSLEREQIAPYQRLGAETVETTRARQAFGKPDATIGAHAPVVADAPDADDLIDAAARAGYVQWMFRPVRGGLWSMPRDDITLEKGGYRSPACPLLGKPLAESRRLRKARREIYAMGRSTTLAR